MRVGRTGRDPHKKGTSLMLDGQHWNGERERGGGKGERRSEVRGAERTYMAVVLLIDKENFLKNKKKVRQELNNLER